jgi:hypothetical protein
MAEMGVEIYCSLAIGTEGLNLARAAWWRRGAAFASEN